VLWINPGLQGIPSPAQLFAVNPWLLIAGGELARGVTSLNRLIFIQNYNLLLRLVGDQFTIPHGSSEDPTKSQISIETVEENL
jgi:hypothetical protein